MASFSSKDEEWNPGPSNSKSQTKSPGNCIIHCTDTNDHLVTLQPVDSWKVLLKAATIRQHEGVLKVVLSLPDGVIPDIKYIYNEKASQQLPEEGRGKIKAHANSMLI